MQKDGGRRIPCIHLAGRGYFPKIWEGVCGTLLETPSLLQTKMVKIYTRFQTKMTLKPGVGGTQVGFG